MATLNDTALAILSAAAAREDLRVLPLPELRAPAHIVKKLLARMIVDGLLAEITAMPEDVAWTENDVSGRAALVVTPAGLTAIGVEPEPAPVGTPTEALPSRKGRGGGSKRVTVAKSARQAPTVDGGAAQSKQEIVLALLRRQEGASVAEMVAATDWQPHSVRGFLAGVAKKRLRLQVTSKKDNDSGRRYYVAAPAADGTEAV